MIPVTLFLVSLSFSLISPVSCLTVLSRQPLQTQLITDCTVPGTAALTFDDGPWLYTEEVSRILTENGATGTFFFNGNLFDCINKPEEAARVQAVFDAGHQVGSHTWTHKDLVTLSREEIIDEMASVSAAIKGIIGKIPAQMRPPFGTYNDIVLEVASSIGQDVVLWNLDSGDSIGASVDQSKNEYNNVVGQGYPILALNHETEESTVLSFSIIQDMSSRDVLPHAIETLRNAGFRLVSVAECTGREPYVEDDDFTLPPSDLTCQPIED